jgi:DNA-binding FrmR family transcriptional regulator
MPITDDSKEKLKLRLAKAIGHLNTVYRMVDEKKYCIDVLNQLKAVQAALDKTAEVMLKQHLETCVVDAIKNQESERVIDELIQVFRKAPGLYTADDSTPLSGNDTQLAVTAAEGKGACCC